MRRPENIEYFSLVEVAANAFSGGAQSVGAYLIFDHMRSVGIALNMSTLFFAVTSGYLAIFGIGNSILAGAKTFVNGLEYTRRKVTKSLRR